jgi:hypothetical protein
MSMEGASKDIKDNIFSATPVKPDPSSLLETPLASQRSPARGVERRSRAFGLRPFGLRPQPAGARTPSRKPSRRRGCPGSRHASRTCAMLPAVRLIVVFQHPLPRGGFPPEVWRRSRAFGLRPLACDLNLAGARTPCSAALRARPDAWIGPSTMPGGPVGEATFAASGPLASDVRRATWRLDGLSTCQAGRSDCGRSCIETRPCREPAPPFRGRRPFSGDSRPAHAQSAHIVKNRKTVRIRPSGTDTSFSPPMPRAVDCSARYLS